MIIKDINIINFGKFRNKEISFDRGMNIIYGENEAGKTTIHTFIRGMLFGIEKQRGRSSENDTYTRYQPWDDPQNYCGVMRIESDGVIYRIERNFNKDNKSCVIVREDIGRELNEEEVSKLFEGFNESCYYNTISIAQLGGATDRELETILKNYAANLGSTKSTELDMKAALDSLAEAKKKITSVGKLNTKKEIVNEQNAIAEELQISEREQAAVQEQAAAYESELEELGRQKSEIAENESGERERIVAGEVRKEKLSSMKRELDREIGSIKSSQLELEYNVKNLGTSVDKFEFKSPDEVQKKIDKANKTSKTAIVSFVLAVVCALLSVASNVGICGFAKEYVCNVVKGIPSVYAYISSSYNYAMAIFFIRAAVCMAAICLISLFVHSRRKTRVNERYGAMKEDLLTMESLNEEINVQKESLAKKLKEVENAEQELIAVEKELADIQAGSGKVSEIDEKINNINISLSKLQWDLERKKNMDAKNSSRLEEIDAVMEAMDAAAKEAEAIDIASCYISEIGAEVRKGFGAELNKKTSERIKAITSGKYDNIVVDDKMNIKINRKDRLINLQRMSKGTVEQIYLALRLSAADILFEKDKKPILMDDAFAMYDNKRMANTMQYMSENVEQVIMFSCHTREKVMADRINIDYKLIRL